MVARIAGQIRRCFSGVAILVHVRGVGEDIGVVAGIDGRAVRRQAEIAACGIDEARIGTNVAGAREATLDEAVCDGGRTHRRGVVPEDAVVNRAVLGRRCEQYRTGHVAVAVGRHIQEEGARLRAGVEHAVGARGGVVADEQAVGNDLGSGAVFRTRHGAALACPVADKAHAVHPDRGAEGQCAAVGHALVVDELSADQRT